MTSNFAGICLVKKNLVLLSKRIKTFKNKPVPLGGYWSPFAGSIEKNESPKECAIRELKEESGFSINSKNVFFQKKITNKSKKTNFYFYIGLLNDFPEINLNFEHTEFGIFKIKYLDTISPIDPKVCKCLKKYYRHALSNKT